MIKCAPFIFSSYVWIPSIFVDPPNNPRKTQISSNQDDFDIFGVTGSPHNTPKTPVSTSLDDNFDIFRQSEGQRSREMHNTNTITSVVSGYRTHPSGQSGVGGQHYGNRSAGYGPSSYGRNSNMTISSGRGSSAAHRASSTAPAFPSFQTPDFNRSRNLSPGRPYNTGSQPSRYYPPPQLAKSLGQLSGTASVNTSGSSTGGENMSGTVLPQDDARRIETQGGFLCELTGEIMRTPVRSTDGHIYEHNALLEFVRTFHINPVSTEPMTDSGLQVDIGLQQRIQALRFLCQSISRSIYCIRFRLIFTF